MVRKDTRAQQQRREAFGHALSEAIEASPLTLEAITHALDERGLRVSTATLSYWQNGQAMPTRGRSLDAVRALEEILDLPKDQLFRRAEPPKGWMPDDVTPESRLVQLVAEMGLSLERRIHLLSSQDSLAVGTDRRTAVQTVRQFFRSTTDGVTGTVMALAEDDGEPPTVEALDGCRIGDARTDPALGLVVSSVVFDRSFDEGEQFWYDYAVHWAPGGEDRDSMSRLLAANTALVSMDVTFDGEPPARAWYDREQPDNTRTDPEEVPVVGRRIQLVLGDAGAGTHTLHWAW